MRRQFGEIARVEVDSIVARADRRRDAECTRSAARAPRRAIAEACGRCQRSAASASTTSLTAKSRSQWPLVGIAAYISEDAGRIEVPVDVVVGADDRVEPPDVLRTHLCPVIAQAILTVVGSAGHLLPLEAPDEVAAVVASAVATS